MRRKAVALVLGALVLVVLAAAATRHEAAGCVAERTGLEKKTRYGRVPATRTVCYVRDRWTGRVSTVEPRRDMPAPPPARDAAPPPAPDARLERLRELVEARRDSASTRP